MQRTPATGTLHHFNATTDEDDSLGYIPRHTIHLHHYNGLPS